MLSPVLTGMSNRGPKKILPGYRVPKLELSHMLLRNEKQIAP